MDSHSDARDANQRLHDVDAEPDKCNEHRHHSGLPDFCGPGGFWRSHPALGRRGVGLAYIASPAAFDSLARVPRGLYDHRLALYRATVVYEDFMLHDLRAWRATGAARRVVYEKNARERGFHEESRGLYKNPCAAGPAGE